jgi:hypothetical protein
LRKEGKSWNYIANLAGVSQTSVQKRYAKLCGKTKYVRGPRKKITWPDDNTLKEYLITKPATHIAEELGVTSSAIKKRCNDRGIKTPPRGWWSKTKM